MLRYLKYSRHSLFKPRFFSISEYFGPDRLKTPDIPPLDESNFRKLYSAEKRLQELQHDNAIIRNPALYKRAQNLSKKKLYGCNYESYLQSNVTETIKGIKGKTAYIHKNLASEEHPNNYRFKEDVDYIVSSSENSSILNKLNSLNYLDQKDHYKTIQYEYMALDDNDHESLYKPPYPIHKNYVSELKPNEIIIQNIPLDSHINDYIELFEKIGKIGKIDIFSDVLNLPAFVKITFEKNDAVVQAQQELHWKVWKGSLLSIKTNQDADYEDAWNRTLCVMNIPKNMTEPKLLETLSEYGRVMQYELPKEVDNPNLPTKEELLEYLEENPEYDINGQKKPLQLKIINHLIDKGEVETYRFPPLEEGKNTENDIQQILSTRFDQLKQRFVSYEIYHTAEWSSGFQTDEEKHKFLLLSTKYSKFFEKSKKSVGKENDIDDINESKINVSSSQSTKYQMFLTKYDKLSSDFHKQWEKNHRGISLKQREIIRQAFENRKLINKGYCFVTFASTDQAKLVLLRLNRSRKSYNLEIPLLATLKEDLEPYELDNEFIFKRLKKIKGRYNEYLKEIQDIGNQKDSKEEKNLEISKQFIEFIEEKKNVKKTIEEMLEKELFNNLESATIGNLRPSENYDRESIGRQNTLSIGEKDFKRLKSIIDGSVTSKLSSLESETKSANDILKDFLSLEKTSKSLKDLKEIIYNKGKEICNNGFTAEDQKNINEYIENRFIYLLYSTNKTKTKTKRKDPKLNPDLTKFQMLKALRIDPLKFLAFEEQIQQQNNSWGDNKNTSSKTPTLTYTNENENKENNDIKSFDDLTFLSSSRRERFFRFLQHLQMLLLGEFDEKSLRMFDQKGVPLDQSEILITYSKDHHGNEYLPYDEKSRVLEYMKPDDENERMKLLQYEEEKLKFWDQMSQETKAKLVDTASESGSLPLQPILEHEIGIPEKLFKPTLKPNQTIEQLAFSLNKEAEIGTEYTVIKDHPEGEVIVKVVKPAYRVNIQKFADLNFEKLKDLARKEFKRIDGVNANEKRFEGKLKQVSNDIERGMMINSNMMKSKEFRKGVEILMKNTPFSRAEIEAIFKADIHDPELQNDIEKQFFIEKMKENRKEIKPKDLIKYDAQHGFNNLKKNVSNKHYTSRFKKI